MKAVAQLTTHLRSEMKKVIVGQDSLRDQCIAALLCRGHILLEGAPGLAKTLLAKTLSRILQLQFQRIQCTSDLMPADIIGTNVLNISSGEFRLHKGPVFSDLLLVDEINRMPPRTQAGLLECMEECQATIDGVRHQLSPVLTVFATQNPIEFEGTYPLPEAQLDRFLLKAKVDYPSAEQEAQLLVNVHNGFDARDLESIHLMAINPEILVEAQREVKGIAVEPALFAYIVAIVRKTREWAALSLGASPRAAINLLSVSKAAAAMDERDYLIPDDVKAWAPATLRHRIMLKPEADLEGITPDQIIEDIIKTVEVPK